MKVGVARKGRIVALGIALAAAACGGVDEAATEGAGGGAAGGAGGAGGACPAGTHDEAGSCVTTLGGFATTSAIADARDHHVTFVVESEAGPFLFVAGGAVDQQAAVPTI